MNYIIKSYPSDYYIDNLYFKTPENTIESKIEELFNYFQLIMNDKHLFDELKFEKEQLNIHKQYIIDKVLYLNEIIEYKIQNKIREKYIVLKNVLCELEINHIVNLEMSKNIHVILTREMLFIMNNNDIWKLS